MKATAHIFSAIIAVMLHLIAAANPGVYIQKDAEVSVSGGAMIFIEGSFSNSGTASNNGQLELLGNWSSNGEYQGEGTVLLMGINQDVSHSGNVFHRLIIDGGGVKNISTDMYINSVLELQMGVLKHPETAKIVAKENAEIQGGSAASYIDGVFYHTGLGSKYYPIGKNGQYMPIETKVFSGADNITGFEFHPAFAAAPKGGQSVVEISAPHYWQLYRASGSLDSALISLIFEDYAIQEHHAHVVMESDTAIGPYRPAGDDYQLQNLRLFELGLPIVSSTRAITGSFFTTGVEQLLDVRLRYIPNALSRSAGNPEDRVVKVYGNLFTKLGFSFRVVNQWGNLIYESNDPLHMETTGWDGTHQRTGKKQATGQYQYIFRAQYKTGSFYQEAGSLYIID
jgi:hypothetical protein